VFVPNLRMVDKGGVDGVGRYVRHMSGLIERVRASGHACAILVHETKDAEVAHRIGTVVGSDVRVVAIADPVVIKATLAGARLVVSSRFHGLVSALAQAVPAVGIGWSHKYAELMRDYGALDCLGSSLEADGDVVEIVLRELDDAAQLERRAALRERSAAIKLESRRMWAAVFEVIAT
jgi:colanic acid/amylovoran biosynthesis protein